MDGLLGSIFGFGDRMKRNVRGLLSDPLAQIQRNVNSWAGNMNDAMQTPAMDYIRAGGVMSDDPSTQAAAMAEANRMTGALLGAMPGGLVGRTVFHGSKSPQLGGKTFDLNFVGSGAGAQTEGWGGYFTNNASNASRFGPYVYKAEIPDEILPKFFDLNNKLYEQPEVVKKAIEYRLTPDVLSVSKKYNQKIREYSVNPFLSGRAKTLEKFGAPPQSQDKFKEWVDNLPKYVKDELGIFDAQKSTGRDFIFHLSDLLGPKSVAKSFEKDGVPGALYKGIDLQSYPDSTNFVIWDDKLLKSMILSNLR